MRDATIKTVTMNFSARRKRVQFADSCGFELIKCKTFHKEDEPICVSEDFQYLRVNTKYRTKKVIEPCFQAPYVQPNFEGRCAHMPVTLELVNASFPTIAGHIIVHNIAYEKTVFVRYTSDNWQTYQDSQARYLNSLPCGKLDRFSFAFNLPMELGINARVDFAICYRSAGQEFWDNNFNQNYTAAIKGQKVAIDSQWETLRSPTFQRRACMMWYKSRHFSDEYRPGAAKIA
eukprot:Colp12_sorted_trinity150504_noHs@35707